MKLRPELSEALMDIKQLSTEDELKWICNYLDKELMKRHDTNKMIKSNRRNTK